MPGKRRDAPPPPPAVPDPTLQVHYVSPNALEPDPENPRTIAASERERLKAGLKRFGFREPLVVRKETGRLIGGHQRLELAREMRLARVPVVYAEGLTDEEARALNILLNNPRAQGRFDVRMLGALLTGIRDGGDRALVDATGFSDADITGLLAGGRIEDEGAFLEGLIGQGTAPSGSGSADGGAGRVAGQEPTHVELAFALTPAQREVVLQAVAHAKAALGTNHGGDGLAHVAQGYLDGQKRKRS